MPSEYDALLESQSVQPKSEYDALLASPQQEKPSAHPILSGIGAGIWRAIPKSLGEVVGFVGGDIVPSAVHEVLQAGRLVGDVAGGASPEQAVRREEPEVMQQGEVLRGEQGTREQAAAITGLGIQTAMLALPFIKPLRLKLRDIAFGKPEGLAAETAAESEVIKNASQKPSAERVSGAQVRPGVDEEAPLRQQGQAPEVRQKAQESAVAPVPQPEQPVSGAGQAQAVSGQPKTVEDIQEQISQHKYIPRATMGDVVEQPKIISTAVQTPEGIKTGESWNEPHDSIAARVATERPSPTQETGIAPKMGETIRFTEPSVAYKEGKPITIQNKKIGRVTKIYDDGRVEVRKSDGTGYRVFSPEELRSNINERQIQEAYQKRTPNVESNAPQRLPSTVGARRIASPEHSANIEKARQEFREAINRNDYTNPKERADAIFAAREKVEQAVADAHVGKPLPVSGGGETPVATPQGIPENQRGFIIREPDGKERFTNDRGEAAAIANAAGQVKPENAGTTALHSQQLAEPVSMGGEAPTVATQPKEEIAAPPETPEALGEALKEKPRLAGPSNRVLQERAAIGEIPQAPESGHGVLKEDLIAQANQRYSPERAQLAGQKALQGRTTLADEADVVLHEEKLTKAAADAERALKANPTDLALQKAYQTARNAMTDWQHGPIAAIKTAWNRKGINLQGATDVDTGTLVGLQKLAWDSGKGDFTPQQRPIMDEAANRVTKAIAEEKTSILKANTEVQKVLKPSRYMDLNQLRESLEQTLKSITC